jgi:hypothetical protein
MLILIDLQMNVWRLHWYMALSFLIFPIFKLIILISCIVNLDTVCFTTVRIIEYFLNSIRRVDI